MGTSYKYTKDDVLKAIENSCGNITTVAKKLKCKSWATAYKYINKWKETAEALNSECQQMNDIARNVIQKDILSGSVQSAKWWLERKCREEFGCKYKPEEQPQEEETSNKFEFIITDEAIEPTQQDLEGAEVQDNE